MTVLGCPINLTRLQSAVSLVYSKYFVCRSDCKTLFEQNLNRALHSQTETEDLLTTASAFTIEKTKVTEWHADSILTWAPSKHTSQTDNIGDFCQQRNCLSCRKCKSYAPITLPRIPPSHSCTHPEKISIPSSCIQSLTTLNVPYVPLNSTSNRDL